MNPLPWAESVGDEFRQAQFSAFQSERNAQRMIEQAKKDLSAEQEAVGSQHGAEPASAAWAEITTLMEKLEDIKERAAWAELQPHKAALDDAISSLTQDQTRIDAEKTRIDAEKTRIDAQINAFREFQDQLKCHEDEEKKKKAIHESHLKEFESWMRLNGVAWADLSKLMDEKSSSSKTNDASPKAASSQAAPRSPKAASPQAADQHSDSQGAMEEVQDSAEPGTTE